ncbi:MAG: NeuD/PglB/VioB family sugar acetyltransferase [Lentisphaeria bacterium]|nr:NeuD/PglB/VioB family sugar acetyltransferase [Lentisphaeria bacterium]
METLVIHGCGGHARSVASAAKARWTVVFVDSHARPGEVILGCPVYSSLDQVTNAESAAHHVAVGALAEKKAIFESLRNAGYELPVLVAPGAVIAEGAELGAGAFIGVGAYVGPNARIGENSILNTHAIAEHDTVIGAHTHISINAAVAGYSRVGSEVMLGAGATVIDKVSVGDRIVIGAGAAVVRDLTKPGTYVGVPARMLRP